MFMAIRMSTEDDCSRKAFLEEKDQEMEFRKERRMCKMKRHKPGYETLMNTRYKEGGKYDAVRWMS